MLVPCTCFQLVYIIVPTCLYTQNRGIEILQETEAKNKNNYERIPNEKKFNTGQRTPDFRSRKYTFNQQGSCIWMLHSAVLPNEQ